MSIRFPRRQRVARSRRYTERRVARVDKSLQNVLALVERNGIFAAESHEYTVVLRVAIGHAGLEFLYRDDSLV